jgi:hypothetical protein
MLKKFIRSSPAHFKSLIGCEYVLVLGLSLLLAWFAYEPLAALNNKAAIALAAVILLVVGATVSKSMEPKTSFLGQCIAIVPIATALRVIFFGGESLFKGLMVVEAGLIIATITAYVKQDFFEKKGSNFIAIVAIMIGCDVAAIAFKWLQFDLVRLIIVAVVGAFYADIWHKSVKTNRKTVIGLVDAGSMVFRAPIARIERLYNKIQDWVGMRTTDED